jgi:hypothetical protein
LNGSKQEVKFVKGIFMNGVHTDFYGHLNGKGLVLHENCDRYEGTYTNGVFEGQVYLNDYHG